jgi:hypothetical protein
MSLYNLLPPVFLWILLLFIAAIYIKHELIPNLIRKGISKAPLAAETTANSIKIESVSSSGFKVFIDITLLNTRLPFSFMSLKVSIPSIRVSNKEGDLIGIIDPSSDIIIDGSKDAELKQELSIDFCESVTVLKTIVKRLSVVGKKELPRISFKLDFKLKISINDYVEFLVDNCSKTINLGKLIKETEELHAQSIKETPPSNLFPNLEVLPFAEPRLGRIEAGLRIDFSRPPGFNIDCKEIKLRLLLNGSSVADATITGLFFNSSYSNVKVLFHISPLMVSSKPLTGIF